MKEKCRCVFLSKLAQPYLNDIEGGEPFWQKAPRRGGSVGGAQADQIQRGEIGQDIEDGGVDDGRVEELRLEDPIGVQERE